MISEYKSKVCYFICCEIILGYIERNKTITSDQTAFFKKQKQLCHEENDDGAGSGMYQEKHQTRVALERYCQLLNNFIFVLLFNLR